MAQKKGVVKKKAGTEALTTKAIFELSAQEAQEVYLVGEFNNWDTRSHPMEKDQNGIWKITLSLNPGRYEYRFLVDGKWENNPSCCDCVPNEFGSQNCIRIVE